MKKISVALILLLCISFSACKKKTDEVYLNTFDTHGEDGIRQKNDFVILTQTVREDSLQTNNLSNALVGWMKHNVFGDYKATTFTQFRLPQLNNVISSQTLDSVVLILEYTSNIAYSGNLNTPLSFNLYELTEDMNSSKTMSNQTYSYNPTVIGSFNTLPVLSDSLQINELGNNVKIKPSIRVKLNSTFANKLFNASSNDLSSQENFLQFFKGIAIVPSVAPNTNDGNIIAFNLRYNSLTKLRIYYNGNQQSDFVVNNDCYVLNNFDVSNQSSEITNQKNSTRNCDTTYVQSMTGAKTKIEFPDLYSFIPAGKTISITKAELIIRPLSGSYNSTFALPKRLLILQPNETTGANQAILDLAEPFFDGNYNSNTNSYNFNITRHIQSLYKSKFQNNLDINRGLYVIIPTDQPIAPSVLTIDSRKNINAAGIELKISYNQL